MLTELRVSATSSRVKEEEEIIRLLFTLSSASKLLYNSTFSLQLHFNIQNTYRDKYHGRKFSKK